MRRAILLALCALLWAGSAGAQNIIVEAGKGGAGGSFTAPLLGPAFDNCAAPPYSFVGDETTGLCSSADGVVHLRSNAVNVFTVNSTAVTSTVPILVYTGLTGTATLGSTLVTNGTFDTDASGWTATNWTWGSAKVDHDTGNTSALSQNVTVTNGQTYEVKWTSSDRIAGTYTVTLGAVTVLASQSSNASYNVTAVAGATGAVALAFTPTTDFDGAIDTVSVKLVTASAPGMAFYDSVPTAFAEVRGNAALFNSAFGLNSLRMNTTGYNNSAQGYGALYSNTTGHNNSAQGYGALYSNTTGSSNSAQGSGALYSNTTGYNNSAQGYVALYSNTTGYNNSAQGYVALYSNTTGYFNSVQGYGALYSNTTGHNNSAQGGLAGYTSGATPTSANAVTTGTRLTFVGYQSGLGSATQRTNSTAIGNEAYVDADNTVVLGDENVLDVLMGSASQAVVKTNVGIQGSKTKALAEGVATTVATVAVPQTAGSNFAAGEVRYTVYASDGTDSQTLNGSAFFSAVNKAGTETCQLTDDQIGTEASSSGTLVCTVACAVGLTDVVGITFDCTSSLTQTSLNALVRFDMQQPNTLVFP